MVDMFTFSSWFVALDCLLFAVTDKYPFKDDQALFKFIVDEDKKETDVGTLKKGMTLSSRLEFRETDSYLSRTIVVSTVAPGTVKSNF